MRVYYNRLKYAHPYWVRLTKVELELLLAGDRAILALIKEKVDKIDGK